MINFHTLDNAANNPTTAYARFRYDLIRGGEGVEPLPYLDSAQDKNPTIGIGFNLRDSGVLGEVLAAFGASSAIADIRDIVAVSYIDKAALRTALNAKMASLYAQGSANRSAFAFSSGATGVEEMRATFYRAVRT